MTDKAQIKKQKNIFDEKSRAVQAYKLENFHRSYLRRIFTALKIPGKGKYLDIGCGALGHLVIEAARKGQNAVGLDITNEQISKAKNFAEKELGHKKNYQFVVGRAEKLPFPNDTFTKISQIAVLEHIQDDEKAIEEIARVLAPGGKVFITVPNSYQKIWLPFRWYYARVDKEMGHLRHYDAKELEKRFSKYGFRLLDLTYTGHLSKIFQYFLTLLFPSFADSKWWWKLEEIDFKRKQNQSGLHFDLVMEKKNV